MKTVTVLIGKATLDTIGSVAGGLFLATLMALCTIKLMYPTIKAVKSLKNYFNNNKLKRYKIADDLSTKASEVENINPKEALNSYKKALWIYLLIGETRWGGVVLHKIGATYYTQGKYAHALLNLYTALIVRKALKDTSGVSATNQLINKAYYYKRFYKSLSKLS